MGFLENRSVRFMWESVLKPILPAGALYLLTFVPKGGPYLSYRVGVLLYVSSHSKLPPNHWVGDLGELPVWLIAGIIVAMVFLGRLFATWWRARGQIPDLSKAIVAGLEWDVMPAFFEDYATLENPAPAMMGYYIKGPYCSSCHSSLQTATEHPGWDGLRFDIRNPCPCGVRHLFENEFPVDHAKVVVYRALQREARLKNFTACSRSPFRIEVTN
jgi:hypothetical protein